MSEAVQPPGQTRRLALYGTGGVVGKCRDFCREALSDWDWPPVPAHQDAGTKTLGAGAALGLRSGGREPHVAEEGIDLLDGLVDFDEDLFAAPDDRAALVEDVLLLVSEVVTNACLHAGGPTELALRYPAGPDGSLRIEVSDPSPAPPRPRPSGAAHLPGGHGLIVMSRLAREWGVLPQGSGKTVWLEMAPLPAKAPPGSRTQAH
ncbi:ATP-binding protein [Streptomyces sp. NPDC006879]|uniref:ATP-binding protein n=1 Tax=Streptomyces sp. NPDC006879 TaxID=3364767 RepID=UPI003679B0DF